MAEPQKLPSSTVITVTDMHAGGHPMRIVESGIPEPEGKTNAEKRAWMQTYADHYRKFLMYLPRGHKDMFGILMVTPDLPEADLGLIFIHNGGYSPMCGDGVMCIGRYAIEKGLVKAESPETRLVLQCPCGPVTTYVTYDGKVASDVRFRLPPCYVFALDVAVTMEGRIEPVTVDIVWGGAFYAFLPAADLGLNLHSTPSATLIHCFQKIKESVERDVALRQSDHPELAFLYGVIFTDGQEKAGYHHSDIHEHICVFGQCTLDFSPCGSGSAARTTLEHHRGLLPLGQKRGYRSGVSGVVFQSSVLQEMEVEGAGLDKEHVTGAVVELCGRGFYTGRATFTMDKEDPLGGGFCAQ